ncbi:gamma-glutamyltransferase family protein [Streptomyces malaysiensis]|uniref:gamma-glutamyltransferase family protein n=1 Tax=Streptomyces malaysiensis TaxID=92644 RepID=UPI003220353A|nr:gamma-glutamyltransferase [Streptomyces malaysiensis]
MFESQTYAASPRDSAPRRAPVLSAGGMAASAHPAVTFAGAAVLTDGGNAVDAALAMAAQSWIALPGQCGVGGDAFAVVREPDGRVWTVCGSGYGPDGGDHAFYTDRGLTAVPATGPLSVAVPGVPAALAALHAESGSRELPALWERAARTAEEGLPCTAKTRGDIADTAMALRADVGAARALLPGNRLPEVGQRLPQPDLARTIRELAADPAGFYTGAFAERAVAALKDAGAPFSGEEWALCGDVTPQPAVTGSYAGRTVHQTPPPSPGWMVVQQAALCDGRLADLEWLGAEAVHLLASAARLAFAERVERCGSDSETWRESLTPEAVEVARKRISLGDIPRGYARAADGDTTSMVAVDAEGRAVSLIHSLAFTFGSKTTLPGTGVLLNNRLGRGAYLIPGHPNGVKPRRRPLHTLNAWLVTNAAGELEHVGNTPGGDGQVQWNTQMLSHLLDHGLDPQAAVDAPRFTVHPGSDADVLGRPDELRCETRLGGSVLDALRARGHAVRESGAWDAGGSGMVISADAGSGCLLGGADSRQDGVALGV